MSGPVRVAAQLLAAFVLVAVVLPRGPASAGEPAVDAAAAQLPFGLRLPSISRDAVIGALEELVPGYDVPSPIASPLPFKKQTGKCYFAAFTGWSAVEFGFLPPSVKIGRPDPLELPLLERPSINMTSGGVRQFLDDILSWDRADLEWKAQSDGSIVRRRPDDGRVARIWRHYDSSADGVILAEAKAGKKIVLIGHSAGGARAIGAAIALTNQGYPVELLIELDTFTGDRGDEGPAPYVTLPKVLGKVPWITHTSESPPDGVRRGFNAYQETSVYYHGRPHPHYAGPGSPTSAADFVNDLVPVEHTKVPQAASSNADLARLLVLACPDDTDDDGVPDIRDNCPREIGVAARPDGCPQAVPPRPGPVCFLQVLNLRVPIACPQRPPPCDIDVTPVVALPPCGNVAYNPRASDAPAQTAARPTATLARTYAAARTTSSPRASPYVSQPKALNVV